MKIIITMLLLTLATNSVAQNKVVVIPLGSDVSAQQFNDLSAQIDQQRVYGGIVNGLGIKEGGGNFSSSLISPGVYHIQVFPSGAPINYGKPSIVATSIDFARVANVTEVSLELVDDEILFVEFRVELRTTNSVLKNSKFSFQLKFADPTTFTLSDQRLKTNIQAVGKTADGFKLYQFNYKESSHPQSYVGIMAQDIIAQYPKAVSTNERGYYKVNYTMLGLKMATLEDWLELGMKSVELDATRSDG